MSLIKNIHARQILDSRGIPTIEVDILTNCGHSARASVPSGASTGKREALELRDGDKALFSGKSVHKAIENVNTKILEELRGFDVFDQRSIDQKMIAIDGTDNKSSLGANAILGVSLAVSKVAAQIHKVPLYYYLLKYLKVPNPQKRPLLPAPMMNFINGGKHASNPLDIQEFMVLPHIKGSFSQNLRAGAEIFYSLKEILKTKGHSTNVGDEGGFAPNIENHHEVLNIISQAIEKCGLKLGDDVSFCLDAAASEFYSDGQYHFEGKKRSAQDMISYYKELTVKYPIYSIEDGLAEEDYDGWQKLTEAIGEKTLTVGDDLFVTNATILQKGIDNKWANSILIKVNQIGTLSETLGTMEMANLNGLKTIISHRSGETGDTFIADLAVGTGAGLIKTGSLSRSDRTEKYNQLLRIEEDLGKDPRKYAGFYR